MTELDRENSVRGEHVWRFRLEDGDDDGSAVYDDPLLELLRVQWEQLLRLTVPTFKSREVKIDGFALMRDPDRIYGIFADDVSVEQRRDRTGRHS